jgi:hypothetical protein
MKNANGEHCTRLNDSKAAPVTNDIKIWDMFVLATLADWILCVVDVQGTFLSVRFEARELFPKIIDGFTTK